MLTDYCLKGLARGAKYSDVLEKFKAEDVQAKFDGSSRGKERKDASAAASSAAAAVKAVAVKDLSELYFSDSGSHTGSSDSTYYWGSRFCKFNRNDFNKIEDVKTRFEGDSARKRLLQMLRGNTRPQFQSILNAINADESILKSVTGITCERRCCGWDEFDMIAFVINDKHFLSSHSGKTGG